MWSAQRAVQCFVALLLLRVGPLQAQGWIEPIRPFPQGAIERVRSAVSVSVTGRLARVTVEEWFRNTGPLLGEADYLYPLAADAVFSDFSLWQGDRELKGEPMDARQARAIYEDIVRRRRDPALIELAGHGLLRARVFPINPGETRKIALRYIQVLERAGDAWRFRYAGGAVTTRGSFRLEADSAARFGDPYSPTHRLTIARNTGRLELTLADGDWSGDLEVLLPLAQGLVGMSLVAAAPIGEDGYFMLLLAPGRGGEAPAVPRDLVVVLDVSGSMAGTKLGQAKAALGQLLATLRSGDRFRLIAFSSDVRRYAPDWTNATPETVGAAADWVRRLEATGATNIAGALAEALALSPRDNALGVVAFFTDGLPTVGESDPERIADQAERSRGAFRVFAFGLGDDVNTYLLDRLTERARGTSAYVRPGEDLERAVGSLAAKIASPVLTDLTLSAEGVDVYALEPERLPDLFAGDELVVFGRYRSGERGRQGERREHVVTVSGRRSGREERFTTEAVFDDGGTGPEYIPQLWAARRAGALERELRLHGSNPELVEELKRLALRYGILTDYTAYLVTEPNQTALRPWGPLPIPAPALATGAQSVAQALRERRAADATVTADVDAVTAETGGGPVTRGARRVGGRLFVWRDSAWTDIAARDSLAVVDVTAFSDAYFALLARLPELTKPAALGGAVLVAGRRVSFRLGASGRTAWGPGELDRLVQAFRS